MLIERRFRSFAPLTLHWSVDGGLWSNPLITYTLGLMAASGKVATQWQSAVV
ncbi:hypothetical protein BD324DRAFT_577876 [Kockovaella imperatae]|uniref:Uncharacterized protein n=1 Tax=Kockovaella imperatae TaxID=4999 RepID=A0A1Y1UJY7_9TREE|nr:hypothetical protein BD324DRAFT_577876 [Kockovaella imperatae]ORX38368.1 hypothetical protein BD324DRAFT_577876 [Kockovaella imperatae]